MADKDKSTGGAIVETVKTIFWALLIAGVFRSFFFQPFWIPSGSMKETLYIGDFLFVNKMAYGYSSSSCPSIRIGAIGLDIDAKDICGFLDSDDGRRIWQGEPERGDVVVFRHPVTGTDYIKRIIGMPGDTVQMQDGVPVINGTPVTQTPDGVFTETKLPQGPQANMPRCANAPVGQGGVCEKTRLIETLPEGQTYTVLDIARTRSDDTSVYKVPEGHYFFMGDNRDNSADSRIPQISGGVGYVPLQAIIGRADRIVFSSAGRSMLYFWTWRGDRFFKRID